MKFVSIQIEAPTTANLHPADALSAVKKPFDEIVKILTDMGFTAISAERLIINRKKGS